MKTIGYFLNRTNKIIAYIDDTEMEDYVKQDDGLWRLEYNSLTNTRCSACGAYDLSEDEELLTRHHNCTYTLLTNEKVEAKLESYFKRGMVVSFIPQ